jgi:hypothetical protein
MAYDILVLMFLGFVTFLVISVIFEPWIFINQILAQILQHRKDQKLLKIELAKLELELEKAKLNKDRVVLPKNNPGEWSSYHEYK